jgi:hypothetical protein
VLWLLLLTTPFCIFILAAQHEVTFTYSDVPNDTLRIWTIQEARLRGIGVSNSRRISAPNAATCTIIDTHFFLWQGSAAAAHECSCYTRPKVGDWTPVAEGADACTLAGESPPNDKTNNK